MRQSVSVGERRIDAMEEVALVILFLARGLPFGS
jgi:hypothetical protein